MINQLRHITGRLARTVLRRFGKTITDSPKGYNAPGAVFTKILTLRPDVILDVGANAGQFATEVRASGYSGRIISFEPQPDVFEQLRNNASADGQWECHCFALGERADTLTMHVSAFSPSSSLLPIGHLHTELMPHTAEVMSVPVTVIRLDEWATVKELKGKNIFLKLDVQGYELPALKGAENILNDIDAALVELNFSSLFVGQSKFHEVVSYLDQFGLKLTALVSVNTHPETGDWLWADGFFMRPAGENK